jgi:Phosphotransferase enzyme family
MSSAHLSDEREQYRLLLVFPKQGLILLEQSGSEVGLPAIAIPQYTRTAEQITKAVFEKWLLRSIVIDSLSGYDEESRIAVLELLSPVQTLSSDDLYWVSLEDLPEGTLPPLLLRLVQRMLIGDTGDRGPFSRFGWIEEAKDWIQGAVRDRNLDLKNIYQLNAGGYFALLRFSTTSGRAYWMKAVGHPNTHEFTTTAYLAEHFWRYLPTIVTMRKEWNAWVMEEAGRSLRNSFAPHLLEQSVCSLAELQARAISHVDRLLEAGCLDRGIPVLEKHLGELTDYLESAMDCQTSTKVPRLEKQRLRKLGCILRSACSKMTEIGIPNTLVHNDMTPGNILYDGVRCVFTDWAEAHIGNPFLTFQHLCFQAYHDLQQTEATMRQLRNAYKRPWLEYLTESQIDHAYTLMPILAVASCLYGRGDWLNSGRGELPRFKGYARSLARQMDREANAPDFQAALCR